MQTRKLLVLTAVVIVGASSFAGCFGGPATPPLNLPPAATARSSASVANAGEAVDFTSTAFDLDGTIATYKWDFGDGLTASTSNATHPFAHQGTYYVTLNVTDSGGASYDTMNGGSPLQVTILPNFASTTPQDQPLALLTLWSPSTAIRPNGSVSWSAISSRGSWNFENTTAAGVATYAMDFGDTVTESHTNTSWIDHSWNGNFTHTYATAGKFAAKLTVTAGGGKTDMTFWDVLVVGVNPTPGLKNKDTLTIQTFGQPKDLDPALAYDTGSGQIIQAVYETLITYKGEATDQFNPALASEIPTVANGGISSDGLTYTFHIRQGVKFHNGDTLTAQDFVYSFDRLLDMNDPDSAVWIYQQVLNNTSITAPNDNTLVFKLTQPYGAFLATLAFTSASAVSKAWVEAHGGVTVGARNAYVNTHMMGTGPFVFRSWTEGQNLLLDKNHAYWDTDHAAKMEHVIYNYITEFSTRLINLKAGDADIITVNSADYPEMRAVANDSSLKISIQTGAPTWDIGTGMFNQHINVTPEARAKFGTVPYPDNVPTDFFQDASMRKAFALAYDRQSYIDNVANGLGFGLSGIIPKGMYGYNASLPVSTYNIEAAKAAYNASKWVTDSVYNPGGYAGGFSLTVAYNCGNSNREQYSLILKGTAEHPGVEQLGPNIHINAHCVEWATYLDLISVRDHRLPGLATWIVGWAPDFADPDDYIGPFLQTGNYFPARCGISYPVEIDAKITAAAGLNNGPERQALYDQIQTFATENDLYIYNSQGIVLHVSKTWVKGWYSNPMWAGKEDGGNLAAIYKE